MGGFGEEGQFEEALKGLAELHLQIAAHLDSATVVRGRVRDRVSRVAKIGRAHV